MNICNHLIFNSIEYFIYLNMWLLYLWYLLINMFLFTYSCLLYYITLDYNDSFMEFFFSLYSILFLLLIISPSLIILLNFTIILIPYFIIYCLGYQWAWTFNLSNLFNYHIVYPTFNNSFTSYNSMYFPFSWSTALNFLLSVSFNFNSLFIAFFNKDCCNLYFDHYILVYGRNSYSYFYLFDMNRSLILPFWSTFKLNIFSFDVIHCLALYSFAIKIDAIPARIHLASILRCIFKGEHKGFCFELCGQGHSSMLIAGINIGRYSLFSFRTIKVVLW